MTENLTDTNVGNIEYIRREDAITEICDCTCGELKDVCKSQEGCSYYEALKLLPSADVAPVVHSRWIKTADGAECENCGREAVYQIVDDHWEYEPWCPHCGAIMDNKRGNENDQ